MWENSAPKNKLFQNSSKTTPSKMRPGIHLQRVDAQLKAVGVIGSESEPKVIRIFLNEFSPTEVAVFSKVAWAAGQEVAVTFQDPRRFYVRGQIAWCKEFNSRSRVHSENTFSYRVGIQLLFDNEEESQAVVKFHQELSAILYGVEPVAASVA